VPLVIPNLAQATALQTCKFWNILQAGWKGVSLTASCCLSTSQESRALQFWGYRQIMSITIWLGKGQYYGPVRCVEEASSHPQLLFIAYLQYSHSSESISGATVDVPISSPYVHTSIPLYYFVFLCAKH